MNEGTGNRKKRTNERERDGKGSTVGNEDIDPTNLPSPSLHASQRRLRGGMDSRCGRCLSALFGDFSPAFE